MANVLAKASAKAAALAVALLAVAGQAEAGPADDPRVVVHVREDVAVPAADLAAAQRVAGRVYERIGVRLEWTGGFAAEAADALHDGDTALHVDVVFLPQDMADRKQAVQSAFGQAGRNTRRAYIYYSRIVAHAMATVCDPSRLLAMVLAHELGHVLLPDYSHSHAGLMQATWNGCVVTPPDFLPVQGTAIRALLIDRARGLEQSAGADVFWPQPVTAVARAR